MSAAIFLAHAGYEDGPGGASTRRSSIGRAVARAAVQRFCGRRAAIERGPGGRPVARWIDGDDGHLGLSISYCPEWIGVGIVEGGRIGLDLEPSHSVSERVALRVMSAGDAEGFRRLSRREKRSAATRYWTCAEALAKASGRGLPQMLDRSMQLGFAKGGRWGGFSFAVRNIGECFVCAVASDRDLDLGFVAERPTLLDCLQVERSASIPQIVSRALIID